MGVQGSPPNLDAVGMKARRAMTPWKPAWAATDTAPSPEVALCDRRVRDEPFVEGAGAPSDNMHVPLDRGADHAVSKACPN